MAKVRVRKRGRTFSYCFEAGKTEQGKRKTIEKGGFATKDDAYEAGIKAYAEMKHGNIGIASDNITASEFYPAYSKHFESNNVESSCIKNDYFFQKHFLPFFGRRKLKDIKPIDIESWIAMMGKPEYATNSRTGVYAKVTLKLFLQRASSFFKYAVYPCQLIPTNPAQYIKLPKHLNDKVVPREVISEDKLQEIFTVLPYGNAYHIPLKIAYYTGMRQGEILGLTWENVLFEERKILVRQQLVAVPRAGLYIKKRAKSKSGIRDIPISEELCALLARSKADQEKSRIGICYKEDSGRLAFASSELVPEYAERVNIVCTRANGKYLHPNSMQTVLKRLGANTHSFRHTHATMLIEAGALPKGVASRLGHSTTTITQDLYTHSTPKMEEETLNAFERIRADKKANADKMQTKKESVLERTLTEADIIAYLGID